MATKWVRETPLVIDKTSIDHNDANPIRIRVTPTASENAPLVTCNQCQTREQLLSREAKGYWLIGYTLDKMYSGNTTKECFDRLDANICPEDYSSAQFFTVNRMVFNYHTSRSLRGSL